MSFYQPKHLPKIMVAPNGARPKKKNHPKVPVTIDEITITAKLCFDAGAEAIHFHIRDKDQNHILNSGLCREALEKLNTIVPKMHLQITTEAVGKYSPAEMRNLAYDSNPPGISIGIREILLPNTNNESKRKLAVLKLPSIHFRLCKLWMGRHEDDFDKMHKADYNKKYINGVAQKFAHVTRQSQILYCTPNRVSAPYVYNCTTIEPPKNTEQPILWNFLVSPNVSTI